MYSLIRPLLYSVDPETIHELTLSTCRTGEKIPGFLTMLKTVFSYEHASLNVAVGNLNFPNPVGLAAGFDKNGIAVESLQALGFGHVEVGTVTPRPQPGNPQKRLYRLREDSAIINRMGFNNHGVDALVHSLSGIARKAPVGVNLGKNKDTPIEQAADDYILGLQKSWNVADYFTINISSPNTQNLRSLQQEENLYPLIRSILETRNEMAEKSGKYKQVWLKIAPDLSQDELKVITDIILDLKIDAMIVNNTTISRPGLTDPQQNETGGLSGKPLFDLSNQVLSEVYQLTEGKIPLIGVGGIFSADDAYKKLTLGASLVQVYTGFIYNGPGIVQQINRGLASILQQKKITRISDLTGTAFQ